MIKQSIKIINKLGLHARAAAKLVNMASHYESVIEIIDATQHVNCKSIMGVLMLGAAQGAHLELVVNGQDEEEALAAITGLIEGKFGEKE